MHRLTLMAIEPVGYRRLAYPTLIGVSLLELLLAIVLCSFVLLFFSRLLFSTQHSMQLSEAKSEIAYHGQLLTKLFSKALQHAGSVECQSVMPSHAVPALPPTKRLYGFSKSSPMVAASIRHRMLVGSEGISVGFVDQPVNALNLSSVLLLPKTLSLKVGDQLLISDCDKVQRVTVAALDNQQGRTQVKTTPSLQAFPAGAWVGKLTQQFFYLAHPHYRYARQALTSLYLKQNDRYAQEMIPGVDDMRITYFTAAGQPLSLSQVKHWRDIKVVRIELLLDSIQPVGVQHQTYQFAGERYVAKDYKLYQAWTIWVKLP